MAKKDVVSQADKIRALLDQGKEVKHIAKELGIRYQSVRAVAVKYAGTKVSANQSVADNSSRLETKPAPQVNLTEMEVLILKAMRTNEFSDIFESGGDWTFAVIQEAGLDEKQARGVISSLIKKGLVEVYNNDKEPCIGYTEAGKEIAKDYPTIW